jgi:FixJ family two-component response regulator
MLELAMPAINPRAARPPRVAVAGCGGALIERIARLAASAGYDFATFDSIEMLLRALKSREPDVLVADIDAGGDDGSRLLASLREREYAIAVILVSARAGIPTIVQAIRGGAVDFLEPPFDDEMLSTSLARAVEIARNARAADLRDDDTRARWHTLTPRERQVCRLVVQGNLNKQIAATLGTSEKTVKVHRAHVMEKMRVRSLAELVHLTDRLEGQVGAGDRRQPPVRGQAISPRDDPPEARH